MKKFIGVILAVCVLATLLAGCGSNYMAKTWGGTVEVDIEADKKLLEVTWKDDSLWILTRPMREDEVPETYEFTQDSNWGVFNGKVILQESSSDDVNTESGD